MYYIPYLYKAIISYTQQFMYKRVVEIHLQCIGSDYKILGVQCDSVWIHNTNPQPIRFSTAYKDMEWVQFWFFWRLDKACYIAKKYKTEGNIIMKGIPLNTMCIASKKFLFALVDLFIEFLEQNKVEFNILKFERLFQNFVNSNYHDFIHHTNQNDYYYYTNTYTCKYLKDLTVKQVKKMNIVVGSDEIVDFKRKEMCKSKLSGGKYLKRSYITSLGEINLEVTFREDLERTIRLMFRSGKMISLPLEFNKLFRKTFTSTF